MEPPVSMDQTPVGKMIEPITQNKDTLSAIMQAIIQFFQGQGQQQPPPQGPLPQVQFDAQGNQVFDPSGAAAIKKPGSALQRTLIGGEEMVPGITGMMRKPRPEDTITTIR